MADYSSILRSTRIRIARNVPRISFDLNEDFEEREKLIDKVASSLASLGKYKLYKMSVLPSVDSEVMLGKHLISKDLIANTKNGAALISEDETISVMVNEEDHIRAQCILKGFNLASAYAKISEIDDELSSDMEIAFSDRFGYLTSCITNVGTGLRASVMMFLPALTISGNIDKIISLVKDRGLTVRGELGENSSPLGYNYQLSNAVSIGLSEREILSTITFATKEIAELELKKRKELLEKDSDMVFDFAGRAYGLLTNCYMIDYIEFMKIIGELKLGVALNAIKLKDSSIIDKLMDICTDSGIKKIFGNNLNGDELCKKRAVLLQKTLRNTKIG